MAFQYVEIEKELKEAAYFKRKKEGAVKQS